MDLVNNFSKIDGGLVIKKLTSLLLTFFIFISVSSIVTAAEITIQPGPSVIQTAVNNAVSGDVIILKPGTYSDNVKISTRNLTIKSYSGKPDDTIIKANKPTADVFLLQGNYIKINGLTISGATSSGRSAINMSKCYYCSIESNKLLDNSRGINLLYSHWNTISKNTAANNSGYGIVLGNATGNVFSGNRALNNARGIHFGSSDSNTLSGNTDRDNSVYGLYVCGHSDRNTIYNNYFNNVNVSIKNGIGNVYNTTKTAGSNIVGGPYIGGNYWAKPDGTGFSQKAVDNNGDGISDSVYTNITGSIYSDFLPLVNTAEQPAPVIPVSSFSSNVTSGNMPLTVAFYDTSKNSPTAWNWNFGDKTYSTVQNPTHTYSAAGNYTVTLIVNNTAGSNTATRSNYIKVTESTPKPVAPVASFTVKPTSGTTATTFTFTDTSSNTPTSWAWKFGDGGTAATKNATHKYAKTGTYTVSVTSTNSAGNSTATKSVVVGTAGVKPVASFTMSPTSGISTSTTCTFTSTSTNSPGTLSWSFGDGGKASGSKVIHKFTKAGTLTVTLTASNSAGSSTAGKTVSVAAVKPVASFTYSPTVVKKGATITFTSTSANYPTALKWTFADNSATSSVAKPTHIFSKTGSFRVTLLASNSAGSSTVYKTITVS